MPVIYITSMADFETVIKGTEPVIIEFWADWCGTCRATTQLYNLLAAQNPAGQFYRLDIEEVREVPQERGIRNLPAFKVYVKGVEVGELVGADQAQLVRLVYKALNM